jgi:hypothetical protein
MRAATVKFREKFFALDQFFLLFGFAQSLFEFEQERSTILFCPLKKIQTQNRRGTGKHLLAY